MRKFLMIALNTVALLGLASMAFAANQLDSAALGYTCLAAALGIGIAAFGCGIGMGLLNIAAGVGTVYLGMKSGS